MVQKKWVVLARLSIHPSIWCTIVLSVDLFSWSILTTTEGPDHNWGSIFTIEGVTLRTLPSSWPTPPKSHAPFWYASQKASQKNMGFLTWTSSHLVGFLDKITRRRCGLSSAMLVMSSARAYFIFVLVKITVAKYPFPKGTLGCYI